MIDIDAAACKKAGLSPSDILTTLQGYYGGLYSSNFNRFGKMYRVMIQADPNSRTNLESLNSVKVRNGNEMAPITQFMSVKRIYGPDNIKRFNMFTAMTINGSPLTDTVPVRPSKPCRKWQNRRCLPDTDMNSRV